MFILIIQIIIVYILSCIIHEMGHSDAASFLGDDTAEKEGRSSLNPFKHLTLFGFRAVPIRLVDHVDLILVNAAGITANLALIFIASLFLMVKDFQIFHIIIWINIFLVVINLIPMKFKETTTDGWKIIKHLVSIIKK